MTTDKRRGYRGRTLCIPFFLSLLLLSFSNACPARASEDGYVEQLLEEAHSKHLYDDPYWHILLHYKHGIFGVVSFIDDPKFFLAPDGKTNPEGELDATIRAFFEPQTDDENSVICRFIARFEWLKEKLGIDPARLPVSQCTPFLNFMNTVKPDAVTLVFPMAYLNSPASMFGHTLLAIETVNRSKLLAYAVTYSAFSRDTMGPLFAVKGVFGLYPGYFSVLPYYRKLQEYSDVDHRDIWEYPLNLDQAEIRRMMLHIRELDSIASDYYFFDENCSYLLFSLLEAARPSVRLTNQVHGWLIPLDSIRMIDSQGLITGAVYRPSRTTKIEYLASCISPDSRDKALAMARSNDAADAAASDDIPEQERQETYDLAGEYLQYLNTKHAVEEGDFQKRFLAILKARSTLGKSEHGVAYPIPEPVNPENGHLSNRLAVGFGLRRNLGFEEIRLRPAYHDLMDSDAGFVEGAQLIFGDIALRYSNTRHDFFLSELDVIDIFSLTPRDELFHPVSWKISTGLTLMPRPDDKDRLVYQLNPGGGFSMKSDFLGLTYVMMETGLNFGGVLDHGYNAGIGGSAGFIRTFGPFKAHIYLRGISYGLGDTFGDVQAVGRGSMSLSQRQSISLDMIRRKTGGSYLTEIKTMWNLYF